MNLKSIASFLQSGGKLNKSNLEDWFSQYDPSESPLEQTLKQGNLGRAVRNSTAAQLPSPAVEAAQGATPTEIPKLEQMPVGMGSWFDRRPTPASVQTFDKRVEAQKTQEEKDKEEAFKIINSDPELVNLNVDLYNTPEKVRKYKEGLHPKPLTTEQKTLVEEKLKGQKLSNEEKAITNKKKLAEAKAAEEAARALNGLGGGTSPTADPLGIR